VRCEEVFHDTYNRDPDGLAFCPYRISPLGAHIDHQYGKINGLALDKGIHIAYSPKHNGVVELKSLNFPKRAQFHVASIPDELAKQQRTAIITVNAESTITSYEEKPKEPKSNLAVPPFYYYLAEDIKRIPAALEAGCGYDAPGSFAAWLSSQTTMKAYRMPGSRYDIGNLESYEKIKASYKGVVK
jgi:hypothetical protein